MGQPIPRQRMNIGYGPRGTAARALPGIMYDAARKVPAITIFFWIAKLLTTALGESTSDYLVYHIDPYIAVGLGFVGLVIALVLQLVVRRYIAWVYWLAVLMVAIFGTMAADVVHIVLKVSYLNSTIFFSACVAIIFTTWYFVEKTLSIHSIYTLRRELFYWAAVMATFALGTAAGDLVAAVHLPGSATGLGYLAAGLLFTVLILLPAIGHRLLGLNAIFAFWFAYIVTRPLGASFADWFGKPASISGLGVGDGPVSAVLTILLIAVVAYLTITHADIEADKRRMPMR